MQFILDYCTINHNIDEHAILIDPITPTIYSILLFLGLSTKSYLLMLNIDYLNLQSTHWLLLTIYSQI